MLRLEGIDPDSSDSTSDSDGAMQPGGCDEAATGKLQSVRSAVSSDGYSPVTIDGGPAGTLTPSMTGVTPAAPLPAWRPSKTRVGPARHDIHVQIQGRRVIRDAGASRVESASENRTKPAEKGTCDSISDGESAQPPLGFVSRKSVALLRKSDNFEPDFQTRMQRFQQKSRQKKEELRQRAAIAEQTSVHTPEINRVRQSIGCLRHWLMRPADAFRLGHAD